MGDIVKRLRMGKAAPDNSHYLMLKAADEIERLRYALEIIAGRRQCMDNLMSNVEVAEAALEGK